MPENADLNPQPPAPQPPVLDDVEALPTGARLAEFEIKSVLGRGGFGIVYLALDLSLQRLVAIKEYLPAALAARRADNRLSVRSAAFAESFEMGLRSFVNESRLLARFDHLALVKVHRFWEANGTAYMVMPYYEGVTLTQVRQSMIVPPNEAWLRRILTALLGALDVMHSASVFHRDVAPDNIVLLRSGLPVLLDFGAARHVLEDQAQAITALVKPAYAPIEQYAAGSEFRQGPWTDIYGASATLHYCLTGKPPPTAAARIVEDNYEPLAKCKDLLEPATGEPYDKHWLAALDWGLEVKPQARPQSIAQWQKALAGPAKLQSRPYRDRTPVAANLEAAETASPTASPEQLAPTRPDRPALAISAQLARVAAAPRMAHGVMAGLMLAALLVVGWSALTPEPPAVTASAGADLQAAPAKPVKPLVVPAVHTLALGGTETGSMERVASVEPAPPEAALPARGKRKAKPVKAKAPASVVQRNTEVLSNGPQIVQARRERVSTRPAAAPTPRDLCSQRGFLGSLICMRDTCGSPRWAQHQQCRNWHQMEQRYTADSR